ECADATRVPKRCVRAREWTRRQLAAQTPGGDAADDRSSRDILCHDASSTDNGVVANGHAFENHGARTNPYAIADDDGLNPELTGRQRVLIGIHNDHVAGNLAVSADCHILCRDDLNPAIEVGTRADMYFCPLPTLDPNSGVEGA